MTDLDYALTLLKVTLEQGRQLASGGRYGAAVGAFEGNLPTVIERLEAVQDRISRIADEAADHDTGADTLNALLRELQPLIEVKQDGV